MSLWRHVTRGAHALTNPSAADEEVADEVHHYLDQATDELIRQGCSPGDAQRIVRLRWGPSPSSRSRFAPPDGSTWLIPSWPTFGTPSGCSPRIPDSPWSRFSRSRSVSVR